MPVETAPEVLEGMYLSHFNIKEKPFTLSTDPRFLWVGPNHRQALSTLTYGLQESEGLVVLGGEFGPGKTTLVNAFVKGLDVDVIVAQLPEPGSDPALFRQTVARGFGIKPKIKRNDHLAEALAGLEDDGRRRKRLLIIDEAQRLIPELQAELLRLAASRQGQSRLIHILLVGQNELYQWLTGPAREAFVKAVSATCKVHPLREAETAAYIDHRLHIAGAGRTPFTPDAIHEIYVFSQGVPRTINLICDYSLLHAHLKNLDQVDAPTVTACKDRFQIASFAEGETKENVHYDLAPVASETSRPGRSAPRRVLPRTALLVLLLLVAGIYFHHDSRRQPKNTRAASVLELSPPPAVNPSRQPEAQPGPVPAFPASNPPSNTDIPPSPPPVETVSTVTFPANPEPTAPHLPPVVPQPSDHDDMDGLPPADQQVAAPSAKAYPQEAPPPPEAESAQDTEESERLEKDNDPGAIIDWLIQENRKE